MTAMQQHEEFDRRRLIAMQIAGTIAWLVNGTALFVGAFAIVVLDMRWHKVNRPVLAI